MKIGNPADKPVIAPGTNNNGTAPANAAAADMNASAIPATADDSAKIELSSSAALMKGGSGSDFDAAKVDRISKSIADGTFKINPGVIADKLIANAHEALAKVQS